MVRVVAGLECYLLMLFSYDKFGGNGENVSSVAFFYLSCKRQLAHFNRTKTPDSNYCQILICQLGKDLQAENFLRTKLLLNTANSISDQVLKDLFSVFTRQKIVYHDLLQSYYKNKSNIHVLCKKWFYVFV